MNDPKNLPRYTNEQVASILSDAIDRRDAGEGRISHEELLETAREIGVTTAKMESAIADALRLRAERAAVQEKRRGGQRTLSIHAAIYAVVNGCLFVIDWTLTGGVWFYWVLLASSLGLAVHAARVFLPKRGVAVTRDADTYPGRERPPAASTTRVREPEDDDAPRPKAGGSRS